MLEAVRHPSKLFFNNSLISNLTFYAPMKMNDYPVKKIFASWKIPKILWLATAIFLSPYLLFGQQRTYTIKGVVKDNTTTLPGASVG